LFDPHQVKVQDEPALSERGSGQIRLL